MNARISKFLRDYSFETGLAYRQLKKHWNKVPRNKRGALRDRIYQERNEAQSKG